MSHESYDLNLVSKRLILAGDIRSISWPNIGDSYGTYRHPCRAVTLAYEAVKLPNLDHSVLVTAVKTKLILNLNGRLGSSTALLRAATASLSQGRTNTIGWA